MSRRTMTVFYSATLFAAAMVAMPIAIAEPEPELDPKVLNFVSCGPAIASFVRTENSASTSNVVGFNLVPGAATSFVVPAGTSQCVKVLFTAKASCRGSSTFDFCYIRATLNGIEMLPQSIGARTFVSEDNTENAHAYQWVRRVGAGLYTARIERRVGTISTSFLLDDWTFDVQRYQ